MVEGSGHDDRRAGRERRQREEKPPICEQDEPGSTTSSGRQLDSPAALANIQPSEPTLWVTPLAGPVLPEVKKMTAGASGGRPGELPAASRFDQALEARAAARFSRRRR